MSRRDGEGGGSGDVDAGLEFGELRAKMYITLVIHKDEQEQPN